MELEMEESSENIGPCALARQVLTVSTHGGTSGNCGTSATIFGSLFGHNFGFQLSLLGLRWYPPTAAPAGSHRLTY